MIKVRLNSDFLDYYDAWFDLESDTVLDRKMVSGPNRIEMYKMLNMIGLKTPKFGMVAELYKDLGTQNGGTSALKSSGYGKMVELVVFTDINAHAGEGKLKMSLDEARERFPGHFAAQFIPTAKTFASRTERLLVIGRKHYWLEYVSNDDWRSNAGDVSINQLDVRFSQHAGTMNEIKSPLYAIDFVAVGSERLAIDFNTSPGISGTPIQDLMSGAQVAGAIKERIGEINDICDF